MEQHRSWLERRGGGPAVRADDMPPKLSLATYARYLFNRQWRFATTTVAVTWFLHCQPRAATLDFVYCTSIWLRQNVLSTSCRWCSRAGPMACVTSTPLLSFCHHFPLVSSYLGVLYSYIVFFSTIFSDFRPAPCILLLLEEPDQEDYRAYHTKEHSYVLRHLELRLGLSKWMDSILVQKEFNLLSF